MGEETRAKYEKEYGRNRGNDLELLRGCGDYDGCTRCRLAGHRRNLVHFRGQLPCQALFIIDQPSKDDNLHGSPLRGILGSLFETLVAEALPGISYGVTSTTACISYEDKYHKTGPLTIPEKEEIEACRLRLIELVKRAKPDLIVSLGTIAARQLKHINLTNQPTLKLNNLQKIKNQGGRMSVAGAMWVSSLKTKGEKIWQRKENAKGSHCGHLQKV